MKRRHAISNLLVLLMALPAGALLAQEVSLEQALQFSPYPPPQAVPSEILIQGAVVWTQDTAGRLENTDVLIRDGRIVEVGQGLSAGPDAWVIDGQGRHVTPGLIDAHSHTAAEGFGLNEGAESVTAEVRVADVLDPSDRFLYLQAAGGLTSANVLHGSANSIGGQNAIIKMRWGAQDPQELLIESAPPGIKFALGENPKRSNVPSIPGFPQRYPRSRMGVAATIREALEEAREYQQKWEYYNSLSPEAKQRRIPPRRNLRLEALTEIIQGKRWVHSHSYRADEILMLIRVAEELGFTVKVFQHVLEGYRVADEIAAHGAGASTFSDWWSYKQEAYEAIPYNAALMHRRGVLVTLNSDNPNLARRMNIEAAKMLRYGKLDPQEALAMVTLNSARQLGIDDRTGSLTAGKDADVVVWNGDPLSVFSSVDYTFVDGRLIFSRRADQEHREALGQVRRQLVDAIRQEGKKPPAPEPEAAEAEAAEPQAAEPEAAEAGSAEPEAEAPEATNPAAPQLEYQFSPFVNERPVAITGATVHTVEGLSILDGVVVFEKGRITAVGDRRTPVPEGARQIKADGKHLWPGIIQMQSVLGLSEIDSVAGTVDTGEMGEINANIDAVVAIHPASAHIPVTRSGGITHAVVAPDGGLVAGKTAVVRLEGWTWEEMAAVPRHSLVLQWPGSSLSPFAFLFGQTQSLEDRKKQAEEKIKELTEFYKASQAYAKAKAEAVAAGRPWRSDPQLESMQPVIEGSQPLFVVVNASWAIEQAVGWAHERGLRIVIVGGQEAHKVADYLAQRKVPVVLTNVTGAPSTDEPYDITYSAPARLTEAGVLVAIAGSDSPGGSSASRNVPFFAGVAAGFGLERKQAYRTITLNPALILGLDSVLGSIAVGKSASLVLSDGDILEPSTIIEQVWIDGHQVSMNDKHKELYEIYRARPR